MCYGYWNSYGCCDNWGMMQFAMGMNMLANFFDNLGNRTNNNHNSASSNPFLVGNLLGGNNSQANSPLVGDLLTGTGNGGSGSVPPALVGNLLAGNISSSNPLQAMASYLPGSFQFDGDMFVPPGGSALDGTGLSLLNLSQNPQLYPYPSLPGVPLPPSCVVDSSGLPAVTTGAYADMLKPAMPMPQYPTVQAPQQQQPPQTQQQRPSASRQSYSSRTQAPPRFAQLTRPSANSGLSLSSPFSGSANDLNSKLGGVLGGKGQVFLDAQAQYGVNAGLLASICMHESGNGSSRLAREQNNVGGVRIAGSTQFRTYNSVDDCIMHMAKFLKSGYLDKGLTSLAQVGAKYCPTNDPTDRAGMNSGWAAGVSRWYNQSFA